MPVADKLHDFGVVRSNDNELPPLGHSSTVPVGSGYGYLTHQVCEIELLVPQGNHRIDVGHPPGPNNRRQSRVVALNNSSDDQEVQNLKPFPGSMASAAYRPRLVCHTRPRVCRGDQHLVSPFHERGVAAKRHDYASGVRRRHNLASTKLIAVSLPPPRLAPVTRAVSLVYDHQKLSTPYSSDHSLWRRNSESVDRNSEALPALIRCRCLREDLLDSRSQEPGVLRSGMPTAGRGRA